MPGKKHETNPGLINESQNQLVSSSAFFLHSGSAFFNDIKVMMEKWFPWKSIEILLICLYDVILWRQFNFIAGLMRPCYNVKMKGNYINQVIVPREKEKPKEINPIKNYFKTTLRFSEFRIALLLLV